MKHFIEISEGCFVNITLIESIEYAFEEEHIVTAYITMKSGKKFLITDIDVIKKVERYLRNKVL